MPSEDTKRLEFNQYQNSDKAVFIIYADFECLIVGIDGCKNQVSQCLQYHHLETQKINMIYTEVKIT